MRSADYTAVRRGYTSSVIASDGKDQQEQIEQATEPTREPGVRQDARGERFPDRNGGEGGDDDAIEKHRRDADRLEGRGEPSGTDDHGRGT